MTTPADDEALLTLEEAIAEFGVVRTEWLRGFKEGLPHSWRAGPTGYRIRRADARAYAQKIFQDTKRPKESTT